MQTQPQTRLQAVLEAGQKEYARTDTKWQDAFKKMKSGAGQKPGNSGGVRRYIPVSQAGLAPDKLKVINIYKEYWAQAKPKHTIPMFRKQYNFFEACKSWLEFGWFYEKGIKRAIEDSDVLNLLNEDKLPLS